MKQGVKQGMKQSGSIFRTTEGQAASGQRKDN